MKAILSSIKEVIKVLKEAGLAMAEIAKFLIHELGVAFEIVAQAIKEFFNVAWETIVNHLRGLGYLASEIADGLKRVGVLALDIATYVQFRFWFAILTQARPTVPLERSSARPSGICVRRS